MSDIQADKPATHAYPVASQTNPEAKPVQAKDNAPGHTDKHKDSNQPRAETAKAAPMKLPSHVREFSHEWVLFKVREGKQL